MSRIEITVSPWRTLDDASRSEYAALVSACPFSTVFHTTEWLDALEASFSPFTRCLLAREEGRMVGAFPFFTLPGPFPGHTNHSCLRDLDMVYGGPVAAAGPGGATVREILDALLDRFEAGPRTLVSVLLPSPEFPRPPLEARGYRVSEHLTAVVDLRRSREELWAGVHPKTRNMISKARRAGLAVREAAEDDLTLIPAMIAAPFRRAGRPPPPAAWLLSVARGLARSGRARVLVAARSGRGSSPVAGAIFLRHRDRSYYWAGGAMEQGYDTAASHLVQWEGIDAARADGCIEHDLVMIDPASAPGIARFKLRFGARPVTLRAAVRRRLIGRLLGRAWRLAGPLAAALAAGVPPPGAAQGRRP